MAVGDQAKKGEQPKIDVSDSLLVVRKAVSPPQPLPTDISIEKVEEASDAQDSADKRPCPKKEDICGICQKLSTFCEENVTMILGILNGESAEGQELICDVKDGRCSKDVVAEKCPIKAMFDCKDSFQDCGSASETCSKFDKMATCPFADKEGIGRCDYSFRLWKSSLPNKRKERNDGRVCGDYVFTSGRKEGRLLPLSVKECCNSIPLPEKADMILKVRPVFHEGYNLDVNSDGFGVRFYMGRNGMTRGEHKGIDIRNKDPQGVDLNSEYYKNVVIKNEENKKDDRGNGFIYCVADGKVAWVKDAGMNSGGWIITIKHTRAQTGSKYDFKTVYMHMSYPAEYGVGFYKGQRIGINPFNKKAVRTPFGGKIIYHHKCEEKNIWGAGRLYDVVLSSSKDAEACEYFSVFLKQNKKYFDGVESELAKIFGNIIKESVGRLWNYYTNYRIESFKFKKKDGTVSDIHLYFARLWIPYLKNDKDLPVKAGDIIGFEANTGLSSSAGGEHLHFEISKIEGPNLNCYRVLDSSIPNPPKFLK